MSQVLSIRLRQPQAERLGRLARSLGRSPGETGALLLEEALRMSEFAFIEFRNSAVGRQAYIQGSSLAVWEVIMLLRAYRGDIARVAAHLQWPVHRVQAAVNYADAFPNDINAAIEDNESYDAQKVSRMLPQTRVITVVDGDLIGETRPHVAPAP
jgi:hypothetical protein